MAIKSLHDRNHSFDGLRGAAVLAVLFAHSLPSIFPYGHIGVDVFFVLSGYLVTRLLWPADSLNVAKIARFWTKRVLRLAPPLLAVVLATMLFSWIVHTPEETFSAGLSAGAAALWSANLVLPLMGGYFDSETSTIMLLHTWSLGVEMQFYLLFPLGLWIARKAPRVMAVVGFGVFVASLGHAIDLYGQGSAWHHYSPFARAWQLLAGVGLGVWHAQGRALPLPGRPTHWMIALIALLLLPVFLSNTPLFQLIGVFLTVGFLAAVGQSHGDERLPTTSIFLKTGRISYSLYLWHHPVFAALLLIAPAGSLLFVALGWPMAIALGALFYNLVEKPVLRKGVANAYWRLMGVAALTFGVVMVSFAALLTQGFTQRYDASPYWAQKNDSRIHDVIACGFPLVADDPNRLEFCFLPEQGMSNTPTLAVWGDSFAMSLVSGFLDAPTHPNVLHLGMDGCPFQIEDSWSSLFRRCQWRHESALARVTDDASIQTVVILSRWNVSQAPGEKDRLLASFQRALDAMNAAGKTILFVETTPYFPRNVAASALRDDRLGTRTTPRAFMDELRADPTSARVEAQALAQKAGAIFVPSLDLLCQNNECPGVSDGHLLYHDDEHLTPHAARALAERVMATRQPTHTSRP